MLGSHLKRHELHVSGERETGCAAEALLYVMLVSASVQKNVLRGCKARCEVFTSEWLNSIFNFSWVYEFLNLQECVLFCEQNNINKGYFPKHTPEIVLREGSSDLQASVDFQRRQEGPSSPCHTAAWQCAEPQPQLGPQGHTALNVCGLGAQGRRGGHCAGKGHR